MTPQNPGNNSFWRLGKNPVKQAAICLLTLVGLLAFVLALAPAFDEWLHRHPLLAVVLLVWLIA